MKSLLQLENFRLDSLEIRVKPTRETEKFEEGEVITNIKIGYDVKQKKDEPMRFLIPLTIELTSPEGSDWEFEKIAVSLRGYFSFPKGTEESEIQKYVPLLCLTNLYGIARGIIAQATGMCDKGSYLLPLINMVEVVRDIETKRMEDVSVAQKRETKLSKKIVAKKKVAKKKAAKKKAAKKKVG